MANRDNHYEAAFEAWLRDRRVPYVAVDEARRSRFPGGSIKSLDFIVSLPGGFCWLVDVKGRRFPSGRQKQYWKNWSTRDDLVSLARWERWFGERFGALFVFAYNVVGNRSPLPAERLFEFRGGLYAFVGVRLREYATHARPISRRWDTLAISAANFRRLAVPVDEFFESDCPALA
ncbi:MAG: HYExAFE family protein [Pirellulales bacterium]